MTTTTQPRASFARRLGALLLAACYCAHLPGYGAPTLPQVVAGQATFSQQGNVFSITNTPDAIINWQSFNIGAGEITRFIQQSGDSAVLNRVNGQDPSKILGALQSNGKVFLINPNGILFGKESRVDVNGLVASTLNLSDADFRAGKHNFQGGGQAGGVRNEGAIATSRGGKVFLVAPKVENTGIITAPGGEVVLAAGHSVRLVDSRDPNMQVLVSAPQDQAVNLGSIVSQGGRIGIYGALVGQRGLVNAASAVLGENGRIVLKASGSATVGQGSVTSALGAGKGGAIQVLGREVAIEGGALLDASGREGGGAVLLGGDYQGGNGVQRAQATRVDAGSVVRADALGGGDGGKVVLWSDGATTARGSISAKGAARGGLVETSGHLLDVDGVQIDARGARLNGTWLLDPYDIEVVAGGTATSSEVASNANGAQTGVTRIAPSTLAAAGTDIVLQAQHDLTITDAINTGANVRAQAGHDINVNAQVGTSGGDLDFRAGNAFNLNAGGALKSNNYIDIQANQVQLAGAIGSAGGQKPVLTFTSFDAARPIVVGSGDAATGALWLDAGRLGSLSSSLYEINLGNSVHAGAIRIGALFAASSHLVLENKGAIEIAGAVDLGASPDSRFIATVYGAGADIRLLKPVKASKAILLDASAGIFQSAESSLETAALGLRGGSMVLNGANHIGTLAASSTGNSFQLNNLGDLTIGSVGSLSGIAAPNAELHLKTSGSLQLDANVGVLAAFLEGHGIGGGGVLKANYTSLRSDAGIGAAAAPLRTSTSALSAYNNGTGQPISVSNDRALILAGAVQDGAGNGGAIAIDSTGGLTVPSYSEGGGDGMASGEVRTSSGNISLTTHSPMTIQGRVTTDSGDISLVAGNGGAMTIAAGARVASGSGSVSVTAGSTDIAAGAIQVSSPDKLHLPGSNNPDGSNSGQQPAPDLNTCVKNKEAPGCGEVIRKAVQECIANDSAPQCQDVLPKLEDCRKDGSAFGCGFVLERQQRHEIDLCLANPALDGCAGKVPTVEACQQNATYGCATVIERHQIDVCLADPTQQGCAGKVPTYEACQQSVSYGCGAVIQRHDAITACLATPDSAACKPIMPGIEACRADDKVYGCQAVIRQADFQACLVNPQGAGCMALLPTLQECKATPSKDGCAVVMELAYQACLGNPLDGSCEGMLPKIGECVADPTRRGCEAVLPRLDECITTPARQGCSVRLPRLEVCAAQPGTPGCEAVLPKPDFCATHPGDASCTIFSGNGGAAQSPAAKPVAQAVQNVVQLLNQGKADVAPMALEQPAGENNKNPGQGGKAAGPSPAENTGAKNEKPATKMYCN